MRNVSQTLLWLLFGATRCGVSNPPSSLLLRPCHIAGLPEEAQCGTYEVFENRRERAGRKLGIELTVVPAFGRAPKPDPIVILAGGPGQGARSYGALVGRFTRRVRRGRDFVLVDLRGTGDSHPLECATGDVEILAEGYPPPETLAACLDTLEADVRQYTTEAAMEDLDEIRAALGYERVNLWGGSYGTRAALVYTRLHPDRVRTVTLDGAMPFENRFPLFTAADAERALGLLVDSCERDVDCRRVFPDFEGDLRTVLERLDRAPRSVELPHTRTGQATRIRVGRNGFASGLRLFLYTPAHARLIPLVVAEAKRENYAPFAALALEGLSWSTDTMALGFTLSVLCSEDVPRIGDAEAESETRNTFIGRSEIDAWRTMCSAWRPDRPAADALAPIPLATPALILSGLRDPATPPRWGETMARHFPASRRVSVPGAGHNASFTGCVPDLIADFIELGSADTLDASCVERSTPPPFVLGAWGTAP